MGSLKFPMKNNLIDKLLLPSASGRHRGHTEISTEQHYVPVDSFTNKGYLHVCALGNDNGGEDTELSFSVHPAFRLLLDVFGT